MQTFYVFLCILYALLNVKAHQYWGAVRNITQFYVLLSTGSFTRLPFLFSLPYISHKLLFMYHVLNNNTSQLDSQVEGVTTC
jgi:hypothetical protein